MKYLLLICAAALSLTGCQAPATNEAAVKEISPAAAQMEVSKAYSQFIDVRTPEEYTGGHAARAVNIPLDTLAANLDRLERNEPVYIICETGNRSKTAAGVLTEAGYNMVLSVAGGTAAWKEAGLPMATRAPHTVPTPK